jgi:hypothetical protein
MPHNRDSELRDAIHNRQIDRVRALLTEGADLRLVDDNGMTRMALR